MWEAKLIKLLEDSLYDLRFGKTYKAQKNIKRERLINSTILKWEFCSLKDNIKTRKSSHKREIIFATSHVTAKASV